LQQGHLHENRPEKMTQALLAYVFKWDFGNTWHSKKNKEQVYECHARNLVHFGLLASVFYQLLSCL